MSINSINTFIRTVFLTVPLKIVQSISWIALSILALPSFVVGRKHSYFFARKAVEVWTESKTEATIKASKVNPNINLSTNLILEQKDAPKEENRQENDSLALNNLKLTSVPNIFNDSCFSSLKSLNPSDNRLEALPESKANPNTNLSTNLILEQWVKDAPREENRATAQERIQKFFNEQGNNSLVLNNLKLTSLPNIFDNSCFSSLKFLRLNDNQLTSLPESFRNLQALTVLNLSNNQLTTLPESFDNLQALTELALSHNQLTSLPESLSNLQALTELHLNDNRLEALPESLSNLQALTELYLSYNRLEALPESLSKLQALTHLFLSHNQLTTLPKSLGKLQALTHLDLSENSTLQSRISRQLLDLSPNCKIELAECGLSIDFIKRLKEVTHGLNYSGPRINY